MERKLSRGVTIVGAGMSRFGAFPDLTSRDLFVDAFMAMMHSVDRGLDPAVIEALFVGNFSSGQFENQGQTAPIYADLVGLTPRPATRVEDACASGGVALRQGLMAIASGLHDVVLVAGVEKMTDLPTQRVTDVLGSAADTLYEFSAGFTFPGLYAAIASAYFSRYGGSPDQLMDVAIKNHQNGALNELAQFGITIRQRMEKAREKVIARGEVDPGWKDEYEFLCDPRVNPMIAHPLRLFDCSPVSDGAAALLLVAEELAPSFTQTPLRVIGTGQASDHALFGRDNLTHLPSARAAAAQAYSMAGVRPQDIKLAEVHDCFTIAEVIASEDLAFFEPGQGTYAAQNGLTARDGIRPINSSGGLKSKGHPVGASGVGQVVELWKQMRGEAGARQLTHDVDLALAHNVGGTGQTCTVHIFERG